MLYKFKKMFVILLISSFLFILFGCEESVDKSLLDEVSEALFKDVVKNDVQENIIFPNNIDGVKIRYLSSNSDIISEEGIVTRVAETKVVEVFAFLEHEGERRTLSFVFTVKGVLPQNPDPNPDPIEYMKYYLGVEGLSGNELKKFLHNLIDDHIELSYSSTTSALKKTDEDPTNPNNIILFYTGRSQPKSEYGSGGNLWDKEHVWAKSHGDFGTIAPAGSDLHHLRPTDSSVNNTRGSKDFDEGGSKVEDTYGDGSSYSYYDSDSFEPRDEVKGDVARILFYMAVRYEGDVSGEPDLEINDNVNNGYKPYIGRLSVLLKWHIEDPVDDFERDRNDVIYSYQKNRNPFIDYPQFVGLIWGNLYI